jgi:hypothetical protein
MRKLLLFIMFSMFAAKAYCSNGIDSLITEYYLFINRTFDDKSTVGKFGFGIGVVHLCYKDKPLNIKFGLEYNHTSKYQKWGEGGHLFSDYDLNYSINYLSFPIGVRYNHGKNLCLFVETGGYVEVNIFTTANGKRESSMPDLNSKKMTYNSGKFSDDKDFNPLMGVYGLCGIQLPFRSTRLIICAEYKYGLYEVHKYYFGSENMYNNYFRINIGIGIK